jgi:2-C-methyl-D-erythritol 4-phosphate cytidylyltransferase
MTDAVPISRADKSGRPLPAAPQSPRAQPCFWALMPCAGTGTRAASGLPKQYRHVTGQPLVLHTLAAFVAVPRIANTLVVVAPGDDFFSGPEAPLPGRWSTAMCGGSTRALSVANGLLALQQNGAGEHDWVLVHDAARCLVTPELIDRLIDACQDDPVGGLLAHPVPDTLKLGDGDRVTLTRDRAQHWLAQTPQMFRIGSLRSALRAAGEGITDESSAVEALGLAPKLVRGSATNFKVTYPEDFALAHAVLAARARKPVGHADYDYP